MRVINFLPNLVFTMFGETLCFQNNQISLYQHQDPDISIFDDFSVFPIEDENSRQNIEKSIPKNENNDIDLIKLRNKKNEILNNLKIGQDELAKADQIYPSHFWSYIQIKRIKELEANIEKENNLFENYKKSSKTLANVNYENNIQTIEKAIGSIDAFIANEYPYLHQDENDGK